MKTRPTFLAALIAGAMLLGASSSAAAQQAPQGGPGIIKYRQNLMRTIAGHMAAIGAAVKGEVPLTWHVPEHARSINTLSNMVIEVFPPGSHVGETRARAEIWQQWNKFLGTAQALAMESAKLMAAGTSGDLGVLGRQLGNVGRACGGCHEPFRKQQQ